MNLVSEDKVRVYAEKRILNKSHTFWIANLYIEMEQLPDESECPESL
jgi:hypothetical protein